ncbi:MAG: hypothetical protein AAF371_14610 [Pseudomonadota bacterium]
MSDDFTSNDLMRCMIRLKGRAERLAPEQVVESFSTVGPLLDSISTEDHQIIFGRRGTGKTHALRYLYTTRNEDGDCALFIDMRNLGSDGSIYNDNSLPITDRATRLLIDTLAFIQDGFLDYAFANSATNLTELTSPIDRLGDAISRVRVTGEVTTTEEEKTSSSQSAKIGFFAKLLSGGAQAGAEASKGSTSQIDSVYSRKSSGTEGLYIRFPELVGALRDVVNVLPARRVWVVLDEWSAIPSDLQPLLADMLRRAFFTIPQITVKIGAIEHRARFISDSSSSDYTGFELTSDIRSNVRLDDYLLFDNNQEASLGFFKEFLFRHIKSYCKENEIPGPDSADEVYRKAFNQKTSFEEFVKAVEGVPRDALHIASICGQKSLDGLIDIPNVRASSHRYYQEDKSSQVDEYPALRDLLVFIVDNAIRKKRTNAFLLSAGTRDDYVDALFDRRLVHIRQRNVSSRDNPGARYYHYKIDYGCYVDLIATKQMPQEQKFDDEIAIEAIAEGIDVPTEDDARSYRRSILDLDTFYATYPQYKPEGKS